MPIWLGDIDYMAGIFRNTMAGMMRGIAGRETFIFDGFLIDWTMQGDRNVYWWTAGHVVLNGEILPIEAGSLTIEGEHEPFAPLALKVDITYDDTGDRSLRSGDVVKCYQTRKAIVVSDGGGVKLKSMKRFEDLLSDIVIKSLPSFSERLISEGTHYKGADGNMGGYGSVRLYNIMGAYYMSFALTMTAQSGELPILYEGKLYTNGDSALAAQVASHAISGSQLFNLPLKRELNGVTTIVNIPCEATISSQGTTINVRIVPSDVLPSAMYNGNCFIRIGI